MTGIDASRFGKVAVLYGGWSAEREISLKSGAAVLAALTAQGVDAEGIDVRRADVLDAIRAGQFERAFIALHGRGGEDGVIQALLETLGVAYTGSGVLGSALAMDKLMTKRVWRAEGLPTPQWRRVNAATDAQTVVAELGLPLIVKPTLEGSSIGVTKVADLGEWAPAVATAMHSQGPVIAERWIEGAEYTVAILGEQALPVIRLETPRGFYDFEAKYSAADTRYRCPCGLALERESAVQALALAAFAATGASGWGRVDLMMDSSGEAWLTEINTIPGMTDHSLVPMAAKAAGIDFQTLVLRILETSISTPAHA